MNPLLYKAHPVLTRWIELLTEPHLQGSKGLLAALTLVLLSNLMWALCLPWLLRKYEDIHIKPVKAYLLSLPAAFLYAPLMLTLLNDVLTHTFEFSDRYFLVFSIVVATQLLAAYYAFVIRHEPDANPIGLESGLSISLFMLLVSIPAGLALIGINLITPLF